jgi:hypothetical protein
VSVKNPRPKGGEVVYSGRHVEQRADPAVDAMAEPPDDIRESLTKRET